MLAGVIVIAAAYVGWTRYGVKSSITTSPTPTKSVALSPSDGTTTSSTTGKTSKPTTTQTPTATPNSTPPSGWKEVTGTAVGAGSANVQFSVYVKNDWTKYNENDTAHGPVFFTSNTNCNAHTGYGPGTGYLNCWDHLVISYSPHASYAGASDLTVKTYAYPDGSGNAYIGVNKSLSAGDQQIIFDSVKILSHRTNL